MCGGKFRSRVPAFASTTFCFKKTSISAAISWVCICVNAGISSPLTGLVTIIGKPAVAGAMADSDKAVRESKPPRRFFMDKEFDPFLALLAERERFSFRFLDFDLDLDRSFFFFERDRDLSFLFLDLERDLPFFFLDLDLDLLLDRDLRLLSSLLERFLSFEVSSEDLSRFRFFDLSLDLLDSDLSLFFSLSLPRFFPLSFLDLEDSELLLLFRSLLFLSRSQLRSFSALLCFSSKRTIDGDLVFFFFFDFARL